MPWDIICQIIELARAIWFLVTFMYVGFVAIVTFLIFNKIRRVISDKITVEWAIIPSLWVGYFIYTIVNALIVLTGITMLILTVFGFVSMPMILLIIGLAKDWLLGSPRKVSYVEIQAARRPIKLRRRRKR